MPKTNKWDSKKFKSKGKSYNIVSVLLDDDNITTASLGDSENERYTFTAQADAFQPAGTRSEKSYLKYYEKTTDETQ